MAFRVCVLASGSSGNCTYISSGRTSILVDAGLSGKEIERRLGEIRVDLGSIEAICLSHEHDDHTQGIRVLHRRHGISVYANSGTVQAMEQRQKSRDVSWRVFTTGAPFEIGDLLIEPFSVPHDAMEPVGFVVSGEGARLAVVTDVGVGTTLVRQRLRQCQAVIVEANHDEKLLEAAKRPWYLKQRIRGRQGHLSNEHAAEMLLEVAGPHLQQVYLAHISEECNRHDLALKAAQDKLRSAGHHHVRISLTYPDRISDVWECSDRLAAAVPSSPA